MQTVAIHAVPNALRSEVVGRHGDALKVRLKAPPLEGRANEELVRFVAARLGLPRGSVRLVRGASSRRKALEIEEFAGDAEAALLAEVES